LLLICDSGFAQLSSFFPFIAQEQTLYKKKTAFSALLLNFCHKKQENQAAIFIRFSMDAASNAFRALLNRIPLTVTWYRFCRGSFRIIP
jgi:hypothetical protein